VLLCPCYHGAHYVSERETSLLAAGVGGLARLRHLEARGVATPGLAQALATGCPRLRVLDLGHSGFDDQMGRLLGGRRVLEVRGPLVREVGHQHSHTVFT
jgi:hypothetical protein